MDIKKKKIVEEWFKLLRNKICSSFEEIEKKHRHKLVNSKPGKFYKKKWKRLKNNKGGGGEISIMKGRIFEKVGVNISTVYGNFSKEFRNQIPGCEKSPKFWASGISIVAHLHSPHITAVHFNTRHIITSKSWFGGGTDITPTFNDKKNINFFHNSLKKSCDHHNKKYYPKFKKWCDEYFYLKHRKETRGAGGIFFDYLDTNNWEKDFDFIKDIGECFLKNYPIIIKNNINKTWTKDDREKLLIKRG
ncbi:MAG: Oxygen-dependent coproporphyrinogen-III oxidase, partial [Alphaproteobacteria bacterium MarineAlpha6_Bin6]